MLCRRPRTAVGVFLTGAWLGGMCAASVPNAISYQGVLLDPGGQPASAPTNLRFRIFRGGDATTFPASGILAYHETTTVTPVDGVFSHLIGAGTPAAGCASGPCVLDAAVFGSGDIPVWIEVTLDPDGVAGSSDDDVLLPRTRVGTVGYAYRVASLEGATGGDVVGSIHTDNDLFLDRERQIRFGGASAMTTDAAGAFLEVGAGFPTLKVPSETRFESAVEFQAPTTFEGEIGLTTGKGFVQQAASTFPGGQYQGLPGTGVKMRFFTWEPTDDASDAPGSVPGDDTEFLWIGPYYNASPLSAQIRENPNDYNLGFKFAAGWTNTGGERNAEYQWQHVLKDGSTRWYPFAWNIVGVDTTAPLLDYVIKSTPSQVALQITPDRVSVMGLATGHGDLELVGGPGGGTLYLGGPSGGRLKVEGTTVDSNQTVLSVKEPTAPRTVQLSDASGVVHLDPFNPNIGTVMFGTSTDDADTGNEVCQSVNLVCVAVRSITGAGSDCTADQGTATTLFYAFCRQ